MRKVFRTKKPPKNLINIVFIFIIILVVYLFVFRILFKLDLPINNGDIIYYILEDSNHYLHKTGISENNLFMKLIYKADLNNPVTLLRSNYYSFENSNNSSLVYNENYIEDVKPVIKETSVTDEPIIYIYSTHPTEEFKNSLSIHNINPNIKDVSIVLKDKLNDMGINTIVEENSIPNYLKEHNYNYNQSYLASLYYLKETTKKYPNLKLIIDLHRDGVDYQYSVTSIDNKKYAKIMFVVGTNHPNYQGTLNISNQMNNYLNEKYPGISRGLFINKTAIFNQNFTDNMILIELGGNNNELSEVLNSVDILAAAIKEYINETRR